jgi:putative ABC transport system substrate-binding protein
MKKIINTLIIAFAVLVSIHSAKAQQAVKLHSIGYLSLRFGSSQTDPQRVAFRERLHELRHVEGQNLVTEFRAAEGKPERHPGLAAKLVRLEVDVIVTGANPINVRAAQQTFSSL